MKPTIRRDDSTILGHPADTECEARERQCELLYHRLERGYARIERGLAAGQNVTDWENLWLALLDEYERVCIDLLQTRLAA
jgi:hypothetical protein